MKIWGLAALVVIVGGLSACNCGTRPSKSDAGTDAGTDGGQGRVVPIACSSFLRGPRDFAPGDVFAFSFASGDFTRDGKRDLVISGNSSPSQTTYLFPGNGDGTFGAPIALTSALAGNLYAGAAVDLNGDGLLDLAFLDTNGGVDIFMGQADGGLAAPVAYSLSSGSVKSLTFGDFNHDGALDLAATDTGIIEFLFGYGDGGFATPITTKSTSTATYQSILAEDLRNTGWSDLVVDGPSIFLNQHDGGFSGPSIPSTYSGSLQAGDFNGDGRIDLAGDSTGLEVYLGNGNGTIQPAVGYPVTSNQNVLAIADLNGDHRDDVVLVPALTASINDGLAHVFLAFPDGGFLDSASITVPPSVTAILADFNGDNLPDLLTGGNGVSLRFGLGGGAFQTAEIDAGTATSSAAVGDFNRDGCADIAVLGANLSVLNGNCDGTFGAPVAISPLDAGIQGGLWSGDLNGDGRTDLVVTGGFNNGVSVLLGKGAGTFAAPSTVNVAWYPGPLVSADLNHDQIPDFVVLQQEIPTQVTVLLGEPDGGLRVGQSYGASGHISAIALGDVNGDGNPDLALVDGNSNLYIVLYGKGDGTFPTGAGSNTPSTPEGIAVADFDHDGLADLAISTAASGDVYLLKGSGDGGFTNVGSFNASGYASAYAPRGSLTNLLSTDLNHDGLPDLLVSGGDLGVLLGVADGGVFAPSLNYRSGGLPSVLAVGDFNNDGKTDVVQVNGRYGLGSTVSVFVQCQ